MRDYVQFNIEMPTLSEQSSPKVYYFIAPFIVKLLEQLRADDERWGNTWLQRFPEGQEARIWEHLQSYFDQFNNGGVPVPWLKVAGLAMIGWIRDNYPELWEE